MLIFLRPFCKQGLREQGLREDVPQLATFQIRITSVARTRRGLFLPTMSPIASVSQCTGADAGRRIAEVAAKTPVEMRDVGKTCLGGYGDDFLPGLASFARSAAAFARRI